MLTQLPPLYLLLLSFPSFHTNTSDFQYRFGRFGVPGPERLLEVFPERVPGFRVSFPTQFNLQQVTDICLSEYQEGVGQVQTDYVAMAGGRKVEIRLRQIPTKHNIFTVFNKTFKLKTDKSFYK